MKELYIEEPEKTLKYFICGMNNDGDDSEEYLFTGIETIGENAFQSACNIKRLIFDETLTTVKKKAFSGAAYFETFC